MAFFDNFRGMDRTSVCVGCVVLVFGVAVFGLLIAFGVRTFSSNSSESNQACAIAFPQEYKCATTLFTVQLAPLLEQLGALSRAVAALNATCARS